MEEKNQPLASEIYQDLKKELKVKNYLIFLLVVALIGMGLWHDWRWSQFDTVSIDSQSGPASYVQGENTGGVYFGASSSPSQEGRTGQGDAD